MLRSKKDRGIQFRFKGKNIVIPARGLVDVRKYGLSYEDEKELAVTLSAILEKVSDQQSAHINKVAAINANTAPINASGLKNDKAVAEKMIKVEDAPAKKVGGPSKQEIEDMINKMLPAGMPQAEVPAYDVPEDLDKIVNENVLKIDAKKGEKKRKEK